GGRNGMLIGPTYWTLPSTITAYANWPKKTSLKGVAPWMRSPNLPITASSKAAVPAISAATVVAEKLVPAMEKSIRNVNQDDVKTMAAFQNDRESRPSPR